jgi:hypothetical protein
VLKFAFGITALCMSAAIGAIRKLTSVRCGAVTAYGGEAISSGSSHDVWTVNHSGLMGHRFSARKRALSARADAEPPRQFAGVVQDGYKPAHGRGRLSGWQNRPGRRVSGVPECTETISKEGQKESRLTCILVASNMSSTLTCNSGCSCIVCDVSSLTSHFFSSFVHANRGPKWPKMRLRTTPVHVQLAIKHGQFHAFRKHGKTAPVLCYYHQSTGAYLPDNRVITRADEAPQVSRLRARCRTGAYPLFATTRRTCRLCLQ